jgi:archaellum component FlaG (FlaF/FlaG flagellin family)
MIVRIGLVLFIAGVLVWALLAKGLAASGMVTMQARSVTTEVADPENALALAAPDSLNTPKNLRNPFQWGDVVARAPRQAAMPVPEPAAEVAVEIPPFRLNAIMPGPKPVAILQSGASTVLATPGQEVWGAKVLSIGNQEVKVLYKGHEHVLR